MKLYDVVGNTNKNKLQDIYLVMEAQASHLAKLFCMSVTLTAFAAAPRVLKFFKRMQVAAIGRAAWFLALAYVLDLWAVQAAPKRPVHHYRRIGLL